MKKFFLILFILLDLAVMAVAAFIIYSSVTGKPHGFKTMLPKINSLGARVPAKPHAIVVSTSTAAAPAVSTPSAISVVAPANSSRNILFTYKNPKAKQVLIRADFTGWKGVPMKRDATGLWSYSQALTPDEYAYCFTVDDKIIKDPNNKHTKLIAQTLVSAITVPAKTP